MQTALPSSEYYDRSAPRRAQQRTARLPFDPLDASREGRPHTVPMFTSFRSPREGPGYTPAVFVSPADTRDDLPGSGWIPPPGGGLLIERARPAPLSRPISTRFENGSG
jgi:hypothetical protein